MDLGKVKLPRTGLNTLQQAIHPVHGIAWTDGKQVCLTSFQCTEGGEPKFGDTNVIGQFEHVLGLRWGPLCCADSPALLAVQHRKHVTVWQLQRSALEENKLLCTQTCEMSEPLPLLAQGCVWHPKGDVLALLTKREASVLFSVRADAQRVRAEIRGGGLIRCACWTGDGARLVVAVGTALQLFAWSDVQRTLAACSFCPVFDVGGYVCALQPVGDAQVAAATELPLDKICGLNAGMAFDVPPRQLSPLTAGDEDSAPDLRRRSVDLDRSLLAGLVSGSAAGPVDLTRVLGRHRRSDPSPLLLLRRRDTLTGSGQDSSHLTVVTYERKATTCRKLAVPGILAPDIIALDPRGHAVAVASNSCSVVLVYAVSAATVPNLQRIQLQKDERPKGMCFLGDHRLLLMVGKQKAGDPAFLSSSSVDKYQVRLLVKDLQCDAEASSQLPAHKSHRAHARHCSENLSHGERFWGEPELLLPGGVLTPPSGGRRRLIEEVQSEESSPTLSLTDFSDQGASSTSSVAMETVAAAFGGGVACEADRFKPADPPLPKDTSHPAEQASRNAEQHSQSAEQHSQNAEKHSRNAEQHSQSAEQHSQNAEQHSRNAEQLSRNAEQLSRNTEQHSQSAEQLSRNAEQHSQNAEQLSRNAEQLSRNAEQTLARFAEVQQCLCEIRDSALNGRKARSSYPSHAEAPYVIVTYQTQVSDSVLVEERRPVLLCEGKLCLRVLLDLFSVQLLEMQHGSLWIVLVADADGFVPLTFKPKEELTVRSGRRKLPRSPCSGGDTP